MYTSQEMGVEVSKEKKDASRKIKVQLCGGGTVNVAARTF
jgi:hypothetical protein